MPRAALISVMFFAWASVAVAGGPLNPHLDSSVVPNGCQSCHAGHGTPGSPMLPSAQKQLCMSCHGGPASAVQKLAAGVLTPGARPSSIAQRGAFGHPVDEAGFSRSKGVTCASCHSPHRGMPERHGHDKPDGRKKLSPRDPRQFEHELCESCHGGNDATVRGATDIARRFNPGNASFHPVEAPAVSSSRSVAPSLTGKEINCTDCHGNDDRAGSAGPHDSSVRHVLRDPYEEEDGNAESASAYTLCYGCHDRESILRGDSFPQHAKHISDLRTSCATCHDPHGSVANRALIRFGQDSDRTKVAASQIAGRLAFVSNGPGSGSCYLTCHGYDHAPASYGPGTGTQTTRTGSAIPGSSSTQRPGIQGRRPTRGGTLEPRAPRNRDPLLPGDRP